MLTTAKSIQLLDSSGLNISPITDITSLYYEVQAFDTNIVSRKYVYSGFPVGVYIDPSTTMDISINESAASSNRNISLYKNGKLYKITDSSYNDIIVSNISTSIIPGTTYRQIDVKQYNLSNILEQYVPLDLLNASISYLNDELDNVNSSINDISARIENIYNTIVIQSLTLNEIYVIASQNELVPNKFYLINNYYVGDQGCMYNQDNMFSGPDIINARNLLVKANSSTTLDNKLYNIYNVNGKSLDVYGTYEIINENLDNRKIKITWLKDKLGNEAPYDFYNLIMKYNNVFYYTYDYFIDDGINTDYSTHYNILEYDGDNASININIKNNIIKTCPFDLQRCIIFSYAVPPASDLENYIYIENNYNYIGENSSIALINTSLEPEMYFYNNYIGANNSISFQSKEWNTIVNSIIGNNNNFIFDQHGGQFINMTVGNNNTVCMDTSIDTLIQNLIINSSNNISLTFELNRRYSNIIVLSNNVGTINISKTNNINIVIDNYVNSTVLNASQNSAYLFGSNIYAKSFNTLR